MKRKKRMKNKQKDYSKTKGEGATGKKRRGKIAIVQKHGS